MKHIKISNLIYFALEKKYRISFFIKLGITVNKKKFFWINPLAHHVYEGWLWFFNKYFELIDYDYNLPVKYPFIQQKKLQHLVSLKVGKGNFFNLYKNTFGIKKEDIVVVGDVFTNSLCLTLRGNNIIYYTEYFSHNRDNFFKKIMFFIFSLFRKNKKIIVPTLKAFNTRKSISSKVLYFPEIYFGKIYNNNSLREKKIKILFVGALDDWKKNIKFMLDSLIELKDSNIEIGLCGSNNAYGGINRIDIEKYQRIFGKKLIYYGKVPHDRLNKIFCDYNLFVLPSLVDPIGAVVLEAMAHSMPILISRYVGAADYIIENRNGLLFDPIDKIDFLNKVKEFFNIRKRENFGNKSLEIVSKKHWYKNEELLKSLYKKFINYYG